MFFYVIEINGGKGTGSINMQLNISNLPKGIYLVRVLGKNGMYETRKLILQ